MPYYLFGGIIVRRYVVKQLFQGDSGGPLMIFDDNDKITVAGQAKLMQLDCYKVDQFSNYANFFFFLRNCFLGHWMWCSKTPWSLYKSRQVLGMDHETHKRQLPLYELITISVLM